MEHGFNLNCFLERKPVVVAQSDRVMASESSLTFARITR